LLALIRRDKPGWMPPVEKLYSVWSLIKWGETWGFLTLN
jgi:hypothetical protein